MRHFILIKSELKLILLEDNVHADTK